MKKIGCLIVLIFVLASSFVLAEISISEPLDVYNLGDRLYISTDGLLGAESGNLNINLVCGGQITNMVKIPARAFSNEESQSYSIPYKVLSIEDLEIENLTNILGECQVIASLAANIASTKTFTITDNILVAISLDKTLYNPGEGISVSIEATKANGDLLNGFVEASNASDFSKAIEGGFVDEVFSMPETIEAGTYFLSVHAYDIGRDGVLNEGFGVVSFDINQIVSSVVMSLSDVEVTPGDNFTVGVEVFDQSGIKMDGTVSVSIISPENEVIELAVQSGEFGTVDFVLNSTVGIWRITSSFNDMVEEREFEMLGIQKVDFDFEDSVLSVTNVGNVLYNKTINVRIGTEALELDLNIEVGDVRKFNFGAPNGEYEVVIDDGDSSLSRQVLLTGNAVGISDLKDVGIFKGYSVIWIFLIVVIGAVGALLLMKNRKTRTLTEKKPSSLGKVVGHVANKVKAKVPSHVKDHITNSLNFTNKSPKVQGFDSENYSHEDKTMVDLTKSDLGTAEASLVLKGEKYMSSVLAMSVKNYEGLSDVAKNALHKAVAVAQKKKGLVDWRGDYIFIVFSPIVTKTYKNEILAVKVGQEILDSLNAYNKKFKDKIEFNLGVHVGELIASKVGGKLKYTSIGNTISLAKRISDSDSAKLIISDPIRKKLLRDLKVVKGKEIGGNQTYEITEVKDRAGDRAKLDDLLKRSS